MVSRTRRIFAHRLRPDRRYDQVGIVFTWCTAVVEITNSKGLAQ